MVKDGTGAGKQAVKWFVNRIIKVDEPLSDIVNQLDERCMEIPHVKNMLAEILAGRGDISSFYDVKEI